jgi:hypothetical protein
MPASLFLESTPRLHSCRRPQARFVRMHSLAAYAETSAVRGPTCGHDNVPNQIEDLFKVVAGSHQLVAI